MAFYPEWVVLLDDTAKGSRPAELTPRTAQQIIDAIRKLQSERDGLQAELDAPIGLRKEVRRARQQLFGG